MRRAKVRPFFKLLTCRVLHETGSRFSGIVLIPLASAID